MNLNVRVSIRDALKDVAKKNRRNINEQFEMVFEEWLASKSKAGIFRGSQDDPKQGLLRVTTPEELASEETVKRAGKASPEQSSSHPRSKGPLHRKA